MAQFAFFLFKKDRKAYNEECSNKTIYSSIYCLKALGAFFVICIHCYGPWPIFALIRTAVPLFFMISGFFLYNEDSAIAIEKCVRAFKKIFWITLYANIFYYLCYNVPDNLVPFKSFTFFIGYLGVGSSLGFHLWYLNAFLEALFVVIIALKFNLLNRLWYRIPFFVLLGLVSGKYEFLFPYIPNNLILSRNFLTMGVSCFGIGWLIKKYNSELIKFFRSPVLLTIEIFILSEIEVTILKFTDTFLLGDYLITTFPLAASILLIGVKYPHWGKHSLMEFIGKKYATYVYVFHVFIQRLFDSFYDKLPHIPDIIIPFIVFGLTILFIIVWQKCSKSFFS